MCTDLKLNPKLKKDSMTTRKELGDFCEQYSYQKIIAPSRKKYKKYRNNNFKQQKILGKRYNKYNCHAPP